MSDPFEEHLSIALDLLEKQIHQSESHLAIFRTMVDETEQDVARLRSRAEILRVQVKETRQESSRAKSPTRDHHKGAKAGRPGKQSEQIRQLAKEILREEGRPIMQLDLKERMEAKGLLLQTVNPVDLIRSALRNQPEFRHVRSKGWTLVDLTGKI